MRIPTLSPSRLKKYFEVVLQYLCILLLAFWGLCTSATSFAQKEITGTKLTLDEAVEVALQNHPAIKEFKERSQAAKAQIGVSRANLLPQVSNTSSYYYGNSVPSSSLNIPSGLGQFSTTDQC